MGRYRIRAYLRRHSPLFIADRIPKGRDCMDHDWQLYGLDEEDNLRFGCAYCEVETTDPPWSVREFVRRRLAGLFAEAHGLEGIDLNPKVEVAYRRVITEASELLELLEGMESPPSDPRQEFADFLTVLPLKKGHFAEERENVEA